MRALGTILAMHIAKGWSQEVNAGIVEVFYVFGGGENSCKICRVCYSVLATFNSSWLSFRGLVVGQYDILREDVSFALA